MIPHGPEPHDLAQAGASRQAHLPELLAGGRICKVHFHTWHSDGLKRIPQGYAGMRIGGRVQNDPVKLFPAGQNLRDQYALFVALHMLQLNTEGPGALPEPLDDFIQRFIAVKRRLAFTQHIQIRPIQNNNFYHGWGLSLFNA